MERRLCLSCRFFGPLDGKLFGRCLHPIRQSPGIAPLVRPGELRCRRSFEGDDWAPIQIVMPTRNEDIVLSERPAPYRRQRAPLLFPRVQDNEDHAPAD